ncbi:alpha/beta hydrolase [Aureimonas altamirensis]|uniref:alpha/beta hydrolase n=1 Tax=Aureimonas altamirensis TaxID=370622 RepID=UPI001E308BBB|nr:alpha/beta hydrolase [Aureimonas altamirensis]UHD46409.1 alpha/beta hydrolase [Aureimonas altamirensis]
MAAAISSAQGSERMDHVATAPPSAQTQHLSQSDTIGQLLRHPAFDGFASLILPWDDRTYDLSAPLRSMGALLPYHSEVRPAVAVDALNGIIDEVAAGRQVFYPLYDTAAVASDPSRGSAGLFFFRGEPGAPFAIVSPGGGFAYVGSLHEGFPYAQAIAEAGLNAFVLRYRPGQGGRIATEDLAVAIEFVLDNAGDLQVAPEHYSLWGSSAGARMAAAIGSHGVAAFGGGDRPPPATVVMAYTAHTDLAADEPPTFVVVGERDGIAPPAVMQRRVEALRRQETTVEYREFANLGHGFGLGTGTVAEGWLDEAIAFWRRRIGD